MINQFEALRQFAEALSQHGLSVRGDIVADGHFHRCDVYHKGRHGVQDGSYVLHIGDNYAVGVLQDWTDPCNGLQKWKYKRPGWTPSLEEQRDIDAQIERARTTAEKELAKARGEARNKANKLWNSAEKASGSHPYCIRKQIKPDGLRQITFRDGTTSLLLPLYNEDEKLANLQLIAADGSKKFLRGGQVRGCPFWVAKPKRGQPVCICEGWATGQSIFQATGYGVVVGFDAGNLLAVAEWARQEYPDDTIIICCDDDHKTPGNPGLTAARTAARAVNASVAIPKFGADRKDDWTDFNDLLVASGVDAVTAAIAAATIPDDEADGADGTDEVDKETAETDKQSDRLVQLAASAELFHDADHAGYADIRVGEHRETYPVRSAAFKLWLTGAYYRATRSAPSTNALTMALAVIEAQAVHDGPQHEVFLRVAGQYGCTYLDLGDADWRVVEIDASGWRVTQDAPVRFIRRKGMRPLPLPEAGGSINTLRNYLNLKSDDSFVLAVAFVLAALRGRGPFPVLDVTGEAGTSKTTTLTVLRNLVDPSAVPPRAPPREPRDLFIAANNGFVLAYDNLSSMADWLSDSFCRLATGGGFATRMLYSDDEERLFAGLRPILLGAVEDVVVRGDLADRCVDLQLEPIPDKRRREEAEFWKAFDQDHARILGALLDGVAHGLRELPNVRLDKLPRMADFAKWGAACEGAYWQPDTFRRAYAANRLNMTRTVVDADLVASAIIKLLTGPDAPSVWSGTATELLHALENIVGEKQAARKQWPGAPNALSGRLKRVAPALRRLAIEIEQGQREGARRERVITIMKREVRKRSSASSASSADARPQPSNPLNNQQFFDADDPTDADDPIQTSPPRGNGHRPPHYDT